jgi:hypothetical protein
MSDNAISKFEEIGTNANVTLDDIVSIFTSRYEENLYTERSRLAKEISKSEKDRKDLEEDVLKKVDVSKYLTPHPLIGTPKELNRSYSDDGVIVTFEIDCADNWGRSQHVDATLPVSKADKDKIDKLTKNINNLKKDTREVMMNIRDMGRKERQVRARIVEKKLATTELEHLLKDEAMIKLIELD